MWAFPKVEVGLLCLFVWCLVYLENDFSAGCLAFPFNLTNVPYGRTGHRRIADSWCLGSTAVWPGILPNTLAFQQPDKQVSFPAWAILALDPFPLFLFLNLSPDPGLWIPGFLYFSNIQPIWVHTESHKAKERHTSPLGDFALLEGPSVTLSISRVLCPRLLGPLEFYWDLGGTGELEGVGAGWSAESNCSDSSIPSATSCLAPSTKKTRVHFVD